MSAIAKRVLAVVAVVAVVATAVALYGHVPSLLRGAVGPADERDRLEEAIATSPMRPLYDTLRAEAPEDYDRLMSQIAAAVQAADDPGTAAVAARSVLIDYRQALAAHALHTPDGLVRDVFLAQGRTADAMSQDPALCATYLQAGGAGLGHAVAERYTAQLAAEGASIMRALIAGRAQASEAAGMVPPTPATQEDWSALFEAWVASPTGDESALRTVMAADPTDPDTCAAMRALIGFLSDADLDGAARVRATLFQQMAGG